MASTPTRVILDTDPGNGFPAADIDDGLALGLILSSPELELAAVTIVGGNTPLELGQRSATHMLRLAEARSPVFVGRSKPSSNDADAWRRQLDADRQSPLARDLWRGFGALEPKGAVESEPASEAIVRMANAAPGELTIVAVGPLTNVADAIAIDPDLPAKLKRIVVMGGSFGVWHHPVELNFGYDPESARAVMSSGASMTLVPLDTTLKTQLTLEQAELLKASDRPLTRFLGATCDPWIRWVQQRDDRSGCALHDPLAVAVLIDPTLITFERVRVDVELKGTLTRGRPVSWRAGHRGYGAVVLPVLREVDVAVEVNGARFCDLLLQRLTAMSA